MAIRYGTVALVVFAWKTLRDSLGRQDIKSLGQMTVKVEQTLRVALSDANSFGLKPTNALSTV